MVTVGPREKAIFCQTLAPLLKGLEGKDVIVELKNDIMVFGTLQLIDCFMNLSMADVLMMKSDGTKYHFEFFFLQRKNLRYVRIPNNVSIPQLLKKQVDIATGKKAREERKKAAAKRANYLKKKAMKNMTSSTLESIVVNTSRLGHQEVVSSRNDGDPIPPSSFPQTSNQKD